MDTRWESEELFFDGDRYFEAFAKAISHAQVSVLIQMYDFEVDDIGLTIVESLQDAARRGVSVSVIVDSIGSLFSKWKLRDRLSFASFQVFHELPWERFGRFRGLGSINRRNHRKVIIIDERIAFVGGMNINRLHSPSLSGDDAWRDTSAKVSGPEVSYFVISFYRLWHRRELRTRYGLWKKYHNTLPRLVRLNDFRKRRRRNYLEFIERIRKAKRRVWITTPYFLPRKSLLQALGLAARAGTDVRILVPARSDIFFFPWAAVTFYLELLRRGVKVFEYQPTVLHAKTALIDDWGIVGSSNLNSRSLHYDLEADVVMSWEENRAALAEQFERDLEQSREITEDICSSRPIWQRLFGRIALLVSDLL